MKNINFIKTYTKESSRQFRIWYFLSAVLTLALLAFIMYLQIHSFLTWRSLTRPKLKYDKQLQEIQNIHDQKKLLEDQAHSLKEKLSLLQQFENENKKYLEQLNALDTTHIKSVTFVSAALSASSSTITITSRTIDHVQNYLKTFSETAGFKDIHISSVKATNEQTYVAILKK